MSGKAITLLINSLRGGGAEQVCVTIANGMAERGWDVTLVVLNLKDAVYQQRLNPRVRLANLHKGHARTAFFPLWQYFRREKPKKVLVFNHQLAVLLVLIRNLSFLPYSIISRNISTLSLKQKNDSSFWHKYVIHFLVELFYNRVDLVIAQSSGMKQDLVEYFNFNAEKITIINNPINPAIESFADNNDMSKIQKKTYVLCAGRLDAVKAFYFAIESFALIVHDHPELRLKIAGSGPQEQELKTLARRAGVDDKVDFEGFQRDLIPYYLHAKATILTSLYEGFPNILLESISLGTPVVAFNCPSGPREIVADGVNGYLVRYQDQKHLVKCLKMALDRQWNPQEIALTSERFKSEVIIREYESVCS